MRDAFDDIERQLAQATRARRRRRVPQMPALALVAVLALGGGAAVAATRIASDPDAERAGEKLAMRAVRDTSRASACSYSNRQPKPVLGDVALLHGIAATLPELNTPAEGADPERILDLARMPPSGMVLRQTVRTVDLAGRRAADGVRRPGPAPRAPRRRGVHRGPQAARGTARDGRSPRSRRAPDRHDARHDAGAADAVRALREPGVSGSFGVGVSVLPREPLKPGIIGSGSAANGDPRYLGIADPRVDRIHVEPERGRPKTAHVDQGFYAFTLARGLGKVRLREFDAAGATLRTFSLRG